MADQIWPFFVFPSPLLYFLVFTFYHGLPLITPHPQQTDPILLQEYEAQEDAEGLETAVLGLSFLTSQQHFPSGVMRLKCVARIASIYFQSQETKVVEATSSPHTRAEGRHHFLLGRTECFDDELYVYIDLCLPYVFERLQPRNPTIGKERGRMSCICVNPLSFFCSPSHSVLFFPSLTSQASLFLSLFSS